MAPSSIKETTAGVYRDRSLASSSLSSTRSAPPVVSPVMTCVTWVLKSDRSLARLLGEVNRKRRFHGFDVSPVILTQTFSG